MLTLFPPGNSDLGRCHIPRARVAVSQGWGVPGLGSWEHVADSVPPEWTWGIYSSLGSPQPPVTGRRN